MRRGWSGSLEFFSRHREVNVAEMKQDALHCLLPANAEGTGEEQDWDIIQNKLKRYGVDVTLEELRQTPVVVEVKERLIQLVTQGSLGGQAGGRQSRGE
ncbi:hypothetical protein DMP14_31520 [Pseudonocardia sp. Ae707_Ps2]